LVGWQTEHLAFEKAECWYNRIGKPELGTNDMHILEFWLSTAPAPAAGKRIFV